MHLAGLHLRAIRSDNPAQLRQRQVRSVLGEEAVHAEPAASIAAVAGDLRHGQAAGDLAEGDDAWRQSATARKNSRPRGNNPDVIPL